MNMVGDKVLKNIDFLRYLLYYVMLFICIFVLWSYFDKINLFLINC